MVVYSLKRDERAYNENMFRVKIYVYRKLEKLTPLVHSYIECNKHKQKEICLTGVRLCSIYNNYQYGYTRTLFNLSAEKWF